MTNQIIAQGYIDSNMIITQGYTQSALLPRYRLRISAAELAPLKINAETPNTVAGDFDYRDFDTDDFDGEHPSAMKIHAEKKGKIKIEIED